MNIKQILKRSLFYSQQGYHLIALLIIFFGLSGNIYNTFTWLQILCPSFELFVILGLIGVFVSCGFIGYLYIKVLWFFREAMEVTIEANPYTSKKIAPVSVPSFKALKELMVYIGKPEIAAELDELIKKSEK